MASFIARSAKSLAIVAGLSLAVKLYLIGIGAQDPWTYRFLPSKLCFFCLGGLGVNLLLPRWKRALKWREKLSAISVALLALYILVFPKLPLDGIKSVVLFVLVLILLPVTFIFAGTFRSVDNQIGELSYSIYICHDAVLSWMRPIVNSVHHLPRIAFGAVLLLSVFPAAWVLKTFVADKVEGLRLRVKKEGLKKGPEVRAVFRT